MSDAKREHSEFSHAARAAGLVARAHRTRTQPWLAPDKAQLRMLEPWEIEGLPGGDPYNGVGARAVIGRIVRKSS